jgi:cation diffusion facilitator family transporter
MSKFPETLPLPKTVKELRDTRRKAMIATARRGVILRFVIILSELAGFIYFGSSALLLDALSSLVDVASSILLIVCIILADRPPDRHHPFGHGRFEPIGGLQLGVLLAVLGTVMTFQQISAITHGHHGGVINPHTWIIALVAVVLLEMGYRHLKRTATLQNSPALHADAVHYRIDGINSLFAMIALLFAAYFPQYSQVIDHLGAIFIAVLMIGIGVAAAKNNIHQLLDRTPDDSYFSLVRDAAMKASGVHATEKILIQVYGPDAHVSIDVEVDPHLSVEVAHEITQKVRHEIQVAWPAVRDVIVHVEPYFEGDH